MFLFKGSNLSDIFILFFFFFYGLMRSVMEKHRQQKKVNCQKKYRVFYYCHFARKYVICVFYVLLTFHFSKNFSGLILLYKSLYDW